MAAYCLVYDSRHLQADCQEPGSAPESGVDNRLWANFTFLSPATAYTILTGLDADMLDEHCTVYEYR